MNTKTVYIYDEVTKEFLGAYEAQEDPMEPGKYIEPECSTDVAVPDPIANNAYVFTSAGDVGTWVATPDYRGKLAYDQATGSAQKIDARGALPAGFLLTPPPPTTAQLIAAAVAEKARLTGICNYQIGVLTNATDPDVVDNPDPADAALLILWKKYQQALRKVVTTSVPVTWPTMPALASGTDAIALPQS